MHDRVIPALPAIVRSQQSIRTVAGSIIVNVDKSTGADFGVMDSSTGVRETWYPPPPGRIGYGHCTGA